MNLTLKKIIKPLYVFIRLVIRLNIFKTVYLNFKTQPFSVAVKFPIYVYGKLYIHSLKGKIVIDAPIKSGMIKIGYRYIDLTPNSFLPNQLLVSTILIFKGYVVISGGVSLSVTNGILTIGNRCSIGGGSFIKCQNRITIGDNTRITFGCTVFDSNIHFIKDIESGILKNNEAPIFIGKNCWINAETIVTKGSVIPDYSITARRSFVNNDFNSLGTNLFIVGAPAKPLNTKVQRIFNTIEERRIRAYFNQNPEQEVFNLSIGLYEDENDLFSNLTY